MAWQNAPALIKLTASQQGGKRGAQLWAVTLMGKLTSIAQTAPTCNWQQRWSDRDD
ncbi:MAG TPA: hypothetical protein VF791_15040 [Pyrinomonadaceae bacterium]